MLASGTRQLLYPSIIDALASLSLREHFTRNCQLEASRRENNYLSNTPRFTKGCSFLVGSQPSLSCPSGKSNMLMKMRMEQWWIDTDREETRSTRRKTCAQCHFAHHKSRTTDLGSNPGLRGQTPSTTATVWPLGRVKLVGIIQKESVCTSQKTPRTCIRMTNQQKLLYGKMAVCCDNHMEHMNLYGEECSVLSVQPTGKHTNH